MNVEAENADRMRTTTRTAKLFNVNSQMGRAPFIRQN